MDIDFVRQSFGCVCFVFIPKASRGHLERKKKLCECPCGGRWWLIEQVYLTIRRDGRQVCLYSLPSILKQLSILYGTRRKNAVFYNYILFRFIAYSSKGTKSCEATVIFDVLTNSASARHVSWLYNEDHKNTTRRLLLYILEWKWPSYSKYVFLGNKAGIRQSMSRGNHMISSAIWDKSARVNLEHAEIYAYVLLRLKLLVWFEIRPKLPFEIAKFSHSNTVFFICKNTLLIQYSAGL